MRVSFSIIALLAVIFIASCEENQEVITSDIVKNPATANEEIDPNAPLPIIALEEKVHNFGTIIHGESVYYTFRFKNTGEAPLIIQGVRASCGCTVPEWSKDPIGLGQESQIDVEFNSKGKKGQQKKKITITANTIPNKIDLMLEGEVIVVSNEEEVN